MGSFVSAPTIKTAVLNSFNQVLDAKTVSEVVCSAGRVPVVASFIVHRRVVVVTTQQVSVYDLIQGSAELETYSVAPNAYITAAIRPSLHHLALCCSSGEMVLLSVASLSVLMQYAPTNEASITAAGAPPAAIQSLLCARQSPHSPSSAFGFYTRARKANVMQEQPALEELEALKVIALEWEALSEDSKERFKREAASAAQSRELEFAVFYVGYESGEVCQFSTNSPNSQFTHNPQDAAPALAFAFSARWNLVFVGCSSSPVSSILIYSPTVSRSLRELKGLPGKVLDVAIYDSRNQVIGLGSVNGAICVWDFMTSYLLLELSYPSLVEGVFPTCFKLLLKEGPQLMIVGLSDGSLTLNSYIYDADNIDYRLVPYKIVHSSNKEAVSAIEYDAELDLTLVGDSRATVHLYNHLEAAPVEEVEAERPVQAVQDRQKPKPRASLLSMFFGSSPPEHKEHELAELQSVPPPAAPEQASRPVNLEYVAKTRERVEGKRKSEVKQMNPFEKFLIEKQGEVEAQHPGISRRDMVIKVSGLWAELDEAERERYENS